MRTAFSLSPPRREGPGISIQAIRLGKTKKTTQVIVLQFTGGSPGVLKAPAATVWRQFLPIRGKRASR